MEYEEEEWKYVSILNVGAFSFSKHFTVSYTLSCRPPPPTLKLANLLSFLQFLSHSYGLTLKQSPLFFGSFYWIFLEMSGGKHTLSWKFIFPFEVILLALCFECPCL